MLDHDNFEMREKFLTFLKDPLFIPRYDLSLDDERELALKRLKVIRHYFYFMAKYITSIDC